MRKIFKEKSPKINDLGLEIIGRKMCSEFPYEFIIQGRKMKQFVAYCGLDCEKCEARLATINNDDVLREKVAKEWGEMNQMEFKKEWINCEGCRIDGIKTMFCDSMCEIRQCALGKEYETCKDCPEKADCKKLKMITDHNEEAKAYITT